jgi:hypothetical protein
MELLSGFRGSVRLICLWFCLVQVQYDLSGSVGYFGVSVSSPIYVCKRINVVYYHDFVWSMIGCFVNSMGIVCPNCNIKRS